MSQKVDKGQRTLAVVTKADKSPEGLVDKVTADDVNSGLSYICMRNRIGEESYEEARDEEMRHFKTHPQVSKISKSMVGIPVLAQKLVQVQAAHIVRCLPDIVHKINEKLSFNVEELNKHLEGAGAKTSKRTIYRPKNVWNVWKVGKSLRDLLNCGLVAGAGSNSGQVLKFLPERTIFDNNKTITEKFKR